MRAGFEGQNGAPFDAVHSIRVFIQKADKPDYGQRTNSPTSWCLWPAVVLPLCFGNTRESDQAYLPFVKTLNFILRICVSPVLSLKSYTHQTVKIDYIQLRPFKRRLWSYYKYLSWNSFRQATLTDLVDFLLSLPETGFSEGGILSCRSVKWA